MKTVFIGAGAGCRDILELYHRGGLSFLDLEILAVVDVDEQAPGFLYAAERGWTTLTSIHEAMALPDLELVVELTGDEDVLDDVYFLLPPGARLMDHVLARVLFDLDRTDQQLREQLRAQTELEALVKEDRARLQEILDTLPDVVMVLDPQMRVVRVNRRFEEVTRQAREVAYGRPCFEVFCKHQNPDRCPDKGCPFVQVMETRVPVSMVNYNEGSRGRQGYYQITATPVFNDAGEVVRVIETSHEITEQVLLKRETEESAQRFRQILAAVHGIITIKDDQGRFLLVNPRAERFYGRRQGEMLGLSAAEVFPADVAAVMDEHDRETLESGEHHVSEEEIELRGKRHVVIAERFCLRDYKGDVVGLCCVARDDTRQRELQQEVLRSERLAAVGKLAAGVAHELNNPLTGILTFAEDLLLEADDDDPQREDYELIVNETMRCRRIVRDLLDFSRQKSPDRAETELGPVIRRTVTMVERQASFHDVAIELALDDALPRVRVDAGQVQQAILNLVINARDAMDARGQLRIETSPGADGGHVVVSVRDDGCGMTEEQQAHIFEPFFSTKGEQGNGLGLPAVASILQQHGGHVEVDSAPGEGSTFHLYFPAATERRRRPR